MLCLDSADIRESLSEAKYRNRLMKCAFRLRCTIVRVTLNEKSNLGSLTCAVLNQVGDKWQLSPGEGMESILIYA